MSFRVQRAGVGLVGIGVAVVACAADRGGFPEKAGVDASAIEAGADDDGGATSGSGSSTGSSGGSSGASGTGGTSASSGLGATSGTSSGAVSSGSSSSSSGASDASSVGDVDDGVDASGTSGSSDAGPCPTCALKVQFKQEDGANTTTTNAHLDFNIVNLGSSPQDMDEITLEYFYAAQGVLTSPTVDCYQVSLGTCPSPTTSSSAPLAATFRPYTPPTANADSYVLLSFAGITIPAGGALLLRVGFHNTMSTGTFDETKDFSFTAADSTFTDAPKVPLYYNGLLLWGTAP